MPVRARSAGHQPSDGLVAKRMPERSAPQVHEHVVAVEIPVLDEEVLRVQPDQRSGDRDGVHRAALGPGIVGVVGPGHDADLLVLAGDIAWRSPSA